MHLAQVEPMQWPEPNQLEKQDVYLYSSFFMWWERENHWDSAPSHLRLDLAAPYLLQPDCRGVSTGIGIKPWNPNNGIWETALLYHFLPQVFEVSLLLDQLSFFSSLVDETDWIPGYYSTEGVIHHGIVDCWWYVRIWKVNKLWLHRISEHFDVVERKIEAVPSIVPPTITKS